MEGYDELRKPANLTLLTRFAGLLEKRYHETVTQPLIEKHPEMKSLIIPNAHTAQAFLTLDPFSIEEKQDFASIKYNDYKILSGSYGKHQKANEHVTKTLIALTKGWEDQCSLLYTYVPNELSFDLKRINTINSVIETGVTIDDVCSQLPVQNYIMRVTYDDSSVAMNHYSQRVESIVRTHELLHEWDQLLTFMQYPQDHEWRPQFRVAERTPLESYRELMTSFFQKRVAEIFGDIQ